MKRFKKSTLIWWAVSFVFLIAGLTNLFKGNINGFIGNMVIVVICGYVGYLVEKPTPAKANTIKPDDVPEFEIKSFKMAGVSFNNDDGTSRQLLLRKLKFNDPPFKENAVLELRGYDFEGRKAYGIYANDIQIGNIPKTETEFVSQNFNRIIGFTAIDVYGGGKNDIGEVKNYGAEVYIKFSK